MGIFDKFKIGLSKSSKSLSSGLNDLIFKKKIDETTLNELEDFLIQSDVGVESAKELREKFGDTKVNPKESSKNEIFKIFSSYASEILKPLEKNLQDIKTNKPSVILIAGVNGVGKTTSIAKLTRLTLDMELTVILGAADTFRAAAVEQLQIWGQKLSVQVIAQEPGADPGAVAFDTIGAAKAAE